MSKASSAAPTCRAKCRAMKSPRRSVRRAPGSTRPPAVPLRGASRPDFLDSREGAKTRRGRAGREAALSYRHCGRPRHHRVNGPDGPTPIFAPSRLRVKSFSPGWRLFRPPKGHMPFEPFHLLRFGLSLPLQKFSDRAAEARTGDIIRRPGRDGAIAARELVPALPARPDAR